MKKLLLILSVGLFIGACSKSQPAVKVQTKVDEKVQSTISDEKRLEQVRKDHANRE